MIYHNYSNEIYEDLRKKYDREKWSEKNIIIFGFNVIGMVIASFFELYKPLSLVIVDNRKRGGQNGGKTIRRY